jgi:nucleoside-diphosphate-sugar epimerase
MIAITGAGGFLGRHLADNLTPSIPVPRVHRTDPRHWRLWIERCKPSVVIHCAGLADVRRSIVEPALAYRANTIDTLTLLDGLEGKNVLLIYVATDKVFGDQEQCTPFTPYKPLNPYDASKVAAEIAIHDFQKRNPCVIARFPNFYGQGDNHVERLIPSIMLTMCRKEKVFKVRTNPDATRQYIYIEDAVRCIQRILSAPNASSVHHFGTPIVKSVREVLKDMCAIFNHPLEIETQNLSGEASKLSLAYHTPFNIIFTEWDRSLDCFRLVDADSASCA